MNIESTKIPSSFPLVWVGFSHRVFHHSEVLMHLDEHNNHLPELRPC
jgi:hypothetical protein